MNTNLHEIAFEQILGNYYWGKYGDFKVIVDTETGYINATHLCGLAQNKNGNPKEVRMWVRLDTTKALIRELSSSVHMCTDELLRVFSGGKRVEIRGTYVHPKLVPHIASWASPTFAILVSDIVNAHMVREYKESIREKSAQIDSLERTVSKIQRQNEELLSEIKQSRLENSKVLHHLDIISDELESASIVNDDLTTQVEIANTNIDKITTKLDIATDQRVPPAKSSTDEVFAIYKNPTTNSFYMIRRQKRTFNVAVTRCKNQGYIEKFYCSDSPNAVNLGVRIKRILPKTLAVFIGVIIKLSPGKTPDDLMEYIVLAEREKKTI